VSRWRRIFANGLGDVRVPRSNEPAMGAYKYASSSQMWEDDAAVDEYNDDLLSQLWEEDHW